MAAIVFDLDGTLIDSAPDIQAAVNRMLAEEDRAPLDLATVTGFVGNGLRHLVGLVIGRTGLDMARQGDLTARVLTHYDAVNGEMTRLYPGVEDALDTVRADGHRLAVCTNKPEAPAREILQLTGLAPHFQAVIGGDTLARRKPDPAPLQAAFAALGADSGLYVGDSEVDAETAERAGAPFLLFTEGYRKTPVEALVHRAAFRTFTDLAGLVATNVPGARV